MNLTTAIRCAGILLIALSAACGADLDSSPTYHRDVSRVMQKHCIVCHREGGVAPFSLETKDDVEANAPMIEEVLRRGTMPPWFAAPMKNAKESPWANERVLTRQEKTILKQWARAGFPEGDPADAPQPVTFPKGWQIDPDDIFTAPAVDVQATGIMDYVYLTVETGVTEDRWVDAIQILPGAPQVVHHVLAFIIPPDGDSSDVNGVDYWGVYAPGSNPQIYPDGYARRLPAGSRLLLSMHYTPNGEAAVDQTRIGVRFADQPPDCEVLTASILDTSFEIPPGAENYKVTASVRLPRDIEILGYLPHSHLRGKAARYEVISRSGRRKILLDVPQYDFNWQLLYLYKKPLRVRRGSVLRYTAWYDNSENNPANPDPTVPVRWGEQTFDEMHLGYVEFVVPRRR